MLCHHDIIRSIFSPLVALETIDAQFPPVPLLIAGMIFDLAGKGFRLMAPSLSERRAVGVAGEGTTILASRCSAPSPAQPSSIGNVTLSNPRGSLCMVAAHALVLCAYIFLPIVMNRVGNTEKSC
jgi:hypothetical protein